MGRGFPGGDTLPNATMTAIPLSIDRHRRRGRHRKESSIPATVKRGGRVLTSAILALALLLVGAIAYGSIDNRWYRVVSVQGGSMAPTINLGDIAFVGRPDSVEVGDIGVFQVNGHIVTHRIVGIDEDGNYITQGDANPSPDRWNPDKVRLAGVYLFKIPLLGNVFGHGIGAYMTDREVVSFSANGASDTET